MFWICLLSISDEVNLSERVKETSQHQFYRNICCLLISIFADRLPHYLTLFFLMQLRTSGTPTNPVSVNSTAGRLHSFVFFCVVWGVVIRSKDSCQCSHRDVMFRPLEVWAHVEACHDPCTHKHTHRVGIQRKPHFHTVATFAANHKMEAILTSW